MRRRVIYPGELLNLDRQLALGLRRYLRQFQKGSELAAPARQLVDRGGVFAGRT